MIGIDNYKFITDTQYADENVQEFYQKLSPAWGEGHIKMILGSQATRITIKSAIDWLADNADVDDTVLFFFSGHGSETGYIAPYDYDYDYGTNAIYPDELAAWFQPVVSEKVVIALESCFSGKFQSDLAQQNRVIMLSSYADEYSYESTEFMNGVFSYYILEAFDSFDEVDTNRDFELSAEELAQYTNLHTPILMNEHSVKQHPILVDLCNGEVNLLAKFIFKTNLDLPWGKQALVIDGKSYSSVPPPLYWQADLTHTIEVPSVVQTDDATRYTFVSWFDGNAAVNRAVSKGIYTANYDKEYLIEVVSDFGEPDGGGWYKEGETATIVMPSYIESPDARHYFIGWSGNYTGDSPTVSLAMDSPQEVNASWRSQYLLTIDSDYGEPAGAGWYEQDKTAIVSLEPVQGLIVRRIFTGWSGALQGTGIPAMITMDSPKVIKANWRADYIQLYIIVWGLVVLLAALITIAHTYRKKKPKKES